MKWEEKLQKFLNDWEYKDVTLGVLVCGSYITGNPNSHSDLDVHIILDEKIDFRQRGSKIVDGLLIEYFANTPNQIRKYFKEDYNDYSFMSLTQFATGLIISDTDDIVKQLKTESLDYFNKDFSDIDSRLSLIEKYSIWDMVDDLESFYEEKASEFEFLFYIYLDKLLKLYFKNNKLRNYKVKTILKLVDNNEITKKKYLLKNISDDSIRKAISTCILSKDRQEKLDAYKIIANNLLEDFNIDGFVFKSKKERGDE